MGIGPVSLVWWGGGGGSGKEEDWILFLHSGESTDVKNWRKTKKDQ